MQAARTVREQAFSVIDLKVEKLESEYQWSNNRLLSNRICECKGSKEFSRQFVCRRHFRKGGSKTDTLRFGTPLGADQLAENGSAAADSERNRIL